MAAGVVSFMTHLWTFYACSVSIITHLGRIFCLSPDNTAQLRDNFQSFPSYQQLFGSLDYLQCDPCQSISSPAAYFVDLMRIVDQYITQPNQGNQGFSSLSDRRPDLEQIPLVVINM